MLKQIKALGLVLVIGGMLVGCEVPEEIQNIDCAPAVEEMFNNKKVDIEAEVIGICDIALEQIDYAAGYHNMGMDEQAYAEYAACKAMDAVLAELDRRNVRHDEEEVVQIVGDYMYNKVLEEIHAEEN